MFRLAPEERDAWPAATSSRGFFDMSDRYASIDAKGDSLIKIDAIVPWEEFRPTLERVWREPEAERKSRAGRKPLDAVVMFRTLVLGALCNLAACPHRRAAPRQPQPLRPFHYA